MIDRFLHFRALDSMDCAATCLRMVAAHFGKKYSLRFLRENSFVDREGASVRGIVVAAETIGLQALPVKIPFQNIEHEGVSFLDAPLPCICHWNQNHFVVAYKTTRKHVWIADPMSGKLRLTHGEFKRRWCSDPEKGIAVLLEPTAAFFEKNELEEAKTDGKFATLSSLPRYFRPYRRMFWQLAIGLLVATGLQLVFPFLTQAIVDTGIGNSDLHFVWLILAGQLALFAGQTCVSFLQSWMLLHIGARVNVSLVSDFLRRLMQQPLSFFESKMTGDLLQRIADHRRIEQLLTVGTLNVLLSTVNLLVFGTVLLIYNRQIFFIFLVISALYFSWIFIFLKRRAKTDALRFKAQSENQALQVELIQGMQEIKLQNSEDKRRQKWIHLQARLFHANVRSLSVTQWQDAGAGFFAHLKDILITALAAAAVIRGEMTLGMMLATTFIAGQLNVPLRELLNFIRTAHDAKLSLERMGEGLAVGSWQLSVGSQAVGSGQFERAEAGQSGGGLRVEHVSFTYNPLSELVLKDVNLEIPAGKVTAIVGSSGSGKTTLIKLLLGFYEPTKGSIRNGSRLLTSIPPHEWRNRCGAVLQDGFIFSDSIAANIAESDPDGIDKARLLQAVQVAHAQAFIENLPLGYNTKIGAQGIGLSHGQRQRLLIARAIYRQPEFLFFDEATNALDASNEKIIYENLRRFFAGRTVVVVAHRLSTVKDADQIVVLEEGGIVEQGTHESLIALRGRYFQLVREQLELGA